ncbi:methyl-accepting chemotaxis sensory transducer with Cache sensor [Paraburkholderia eburnea]|uniref:Methyl-accepting chemotaxis sensory transducer with Cache sensor n=1 Tax=Paraburkholderia eburnea TaxID=1189126 RepID=A0A2S4M7N1_9BURK|nr:methyl-accepting chemotaxis protein [Paraburkholderia eburnea]POR50635.1 methyl-accepting chemotaxis sensory transducer with Cache sensor [Paraburkholderia eburnea]PRZ21403.1 methyl-accepting chemotaxis sensory transducer with Cache sensor [Paraburkholderia eburnea]
MSIWRKLSIQNKLVLSMTTCLLIFIGISSGLSIWLIGDTVRERVVQDELPTAVNGIRAEVQRQLAGPITAARAIALDPFLQQWEADGEPDAGAANWTRLAASIKAEEKAASVQWVSAKTGNYYTEAGLQRKIGDQDGWLKAFLATGKPYEVNMDRDVAVGGYMMFINARVQGAGDAASVAGMALSVDALAAGIASYKIGQTGFAYLVHPDGAIMIHRDTSLVDGKHFLKDMPGMPADTAAALLGGKPYAALTYPAPGGTRYVATSFVPELDAYVVVEVPQAELLGPFERTIRTATLIAAVVGLAAALGVILLVGRAIAAPVRRAAMLLAEIADGQGDLTRQMAVETGDELGQLADAFNRFVATMGTLVRRVRASSTSIAIGSTQIAMGNADLSQRTEEQASNLERTAASMEEITAAVKNNTDTARTAAQMASTASTAASQGGEVVGQVVSTMEQISEASRKISEIIVVIDSIAFQTNILALNAAVEAARAGEQGRGFAVVASEVRNLAQRSAQAAKEIKALIEHSAGTVDTGSRLVADAGRVMGDVVAQVQGVSTMMSEITSASVEQSAGIGQIGDAVQQLDQVTQQNAALVEESAAAAESLKQQAAELDRLVAVFKVGEEGALA